MSELNAKTQGAGDSQADEWSNLEKTSIAIIEAFLATPENAEPLPAAMPATWVPCSHPSISVSHGSADPAANELVALPGQRLVAPKLLSLLEKHASSTTLPDRKGWLLSTPVSRIATTVPLPVTGMPLSAPAHALSACTSGTLSLRNGFSNLSGTTLITRP